MNPRYHVFVNEYLVDGDKEAAYALAYPKAKESSRQSAAKRLQQALDAEQAKELLAGIIRGTHITWRNARVKGGFEKIEVYPTHAQILRAMDMYLKLSDLYPKAAQKSGSGKAKEQAEEEEEFENYWITIGDQPFDPVEGTKYAQWYPLYYAGILWNPTKPNERAGWQKYMNTLSEEERAPFLENVRRFDENPQQFATTYNNNQGGTFPNQGRHPMFGYLNKLVVRIIAEERVKSKTACRHWA